MTYGTSLDIPSASFEITSSSVGVNRTCEDWAREKGEWEEGFEKVHTGRFVAIRESLGNKSRLRLVMINFFDACNGLFLWERRYPLYHFSQHTARATVTCLAER